jgi:hypothetical protein
MTLSSEQMQEYRLLKNNGVEVSKDHRITPHTGEETKIHYHAKCAVALLAKQHNYMATCECEVPRGSTDVLLWGHPKRQTLAVEIEHSPTKENNSVKLQKYVRETPIDDMIVINANELSLNLLELHDQIEREVGL